MIFTPAEYLAYIGSEVPAERYYDIALEQLKQICPSFKNKWFSRRRYGNS